MRYEELVALSTPTPIDATPLAAFERRQRLLRDLLEKSEGLRFGELDEDFYAMLRARLQAVGVTGPDIEAFTKMLVVAAVECTAVGSPEREAQFEWIARHFIQADMTVTVGADDYNIRVEFPSQPRTH